MIAGEVRVAASGFGGLDNPEPGTGVARALRQGWRGRLAIDALGYDCWMTGAWTPGLVDRLCLMPPIAQGDEAWLARLLRFHEERAIDVLLPCLDLEVPVASRLARRLRRKGVRTLLPEPEDVYAVAKAALPYFCYANDIVTPHTQHVANVADVALHADRFGYPLVVKGMVAGAARVETREQASIEAARWNAVWGGGVLLQQHIEGDEYNVAAVTRADGSPLGHVATRKLGISQRGKGVIGAVVDDPALEREALRILSRLHWRGPLELEFIRAHNSGQIYLVEINCRFPAWILLSHFADCNLPVLLVNEILSPGRRRRPPPRPGMAFVRDVREVAVPVERLERLTRFLSINGDARVARRADSRARRGDLAVAVTGISAFEITLPGLGVARALRAAPEVGRIYGLGYGPYDTGMYRSDLFDAAFCLPAGDDAGELLEGIRAIHAQQPFDVLVPSLDSELPRFISIEDELAALGIRTLLPSRQALERRAKERLSSIGDGADWGGLEVPPTVRVASRRALVRVAERFGFPMTIKGAESGAIPVYTAAQAHAAWLSLAQAGKTVLAQPLLVGEEFAVATVCDREHRMFATVAIKKLLRCERGNTWGAIVVDMPELEAALGRFLAALKWTGPAEAEFIRDSTRERFQLIEINPRFPSWIGFSAELAANLPRHALRATLGWPAAPIEPKRDLLFFRSREEVGVPAKALATVIAKRMLRHA